MPQARVALGSSSEFPPLLCADSPGSLLPWIFSPAEHHSADPETCKQVEVVVGDEQEEE